MRLPASRVIAGLRKRGKTIALAESCTGGWISKLLTDISGASAVFRGGCVVYSDRSKKDILGIKGLTLVREGSVSKKAAAEMAEGIRKCFRSDVGLSVTGIAGPGGGSPKKPVGTVYMGFSRQGKTKVWRFFFKGGRGQVRKQAAMKALQILKEFSA